MGVYSATNTIDYIQPESPADIYGFMQGDKVVSINDVPIETWDDFTSWKDARDIPVRGSDTRLNPHMT